MCQLHGSTAALWIGGVCLLGSDPTPLSPRMTLTTARKKGIFNAVEEESKKERKQLFLYIRHVIIKAKKD